MFRTSCPRYFLLSSLLLFVAGPAVAQDSAPNDGRGDGRDEAPSAATVEAQSLFAAGQAAYDDARYNDALRYFRLAAEVSPLPALQYNIGLSADRLRLDAEALEAFEAFLRGVDASHPRYSEVRARVRVLRSVDLRVHEVPGDGAVSLESPSKTGLIVGLSIAAVVVAVGVVLAVVLTGGGADPTPGNFGPTFQALSAP